MTLGIAFFISGVLLLRKLKLYYFEFFKNVRVKLWLSVSLLSFTLLLRGILNIARAMDGSELDR